MALMKKPVVLHIATDYPDGTGDYSPTKAVQNLIEATSDGLEHRVVSVGRWTHARWSLYTSDGLMILRFFSPPKGVLSNLMMLGAALWFYRRVLRHQSIDLIHAHKLTTDGVLGYFLSLLASVPLVISVRGDTDSRFIKYKPFSHWLYRRVLWRAEHTFWVSAWARHSLMRILKPGRIEHSLLPNIVKIPARTIKPASCFPLNESRFVFLGRLSNANNKGLWHLLAAMKTLSNASLDVFGQGTEPELEDFQNRVQALGLGSRVHHGGFLKQEEFPEKLPAYTALVMPSNNETFGMVYVEALFCGLPVICCEQSGIDGYLPTAEGYIGSVAYGDTQALSECMQTMMDQRASLRTSLADDVQAGKLDSFLPERIATHYQNTIRRVLL